MSVFDDLQGIAERALASVEAAGDLKALDEVRVAVAGKKGELTAVLKSMGKLSPEERPQVGKLANEVRDRFEAALEARKATLAAAELEARMWIDHVKDDSKPLVTKPEQAYVVTQILEAIYRSAETNRPVYFDNGELKLD